MTDAHEHFGTVAAMPPTQTDLLAAGALFLADDFEAVTALLDTADPAELLGVVIRTAVSCFDAPPATALATVPLQYCDGRTADTAIMLLAASEAYTADNDAVVEHMASQVLEAGNIVPATGALFAGLLTVEAASVGRDPLEYARRCCVIAAADATN